MPVPIRNTGVDIATNAVTEQAMLSKNGITYKHIAGAVVFSGDLFDFDPTIKPFLNESFGVAMNQDVSFGGTPELIFDGGSGGTEWTGTGGAQWNFSSGGKVVLTNGTNNSQALFTDSGTVNSSGYTALTGKVDLDNYSSSNQDVLFQFQLSGAPLGVAVSMNDFIDTGNFTEQSFAIPLTQFNLTGAIVDEFTMTIQRNGGSLPDISFDDFQIEETGSSINYTVNVLESEVYCIEQINFMFIDNVTAITTVAGSTENATTQNLSYNKLLGVDKLSNGIIFTRTQNDKNVINLTLKDLSDFLTFSVISDHVSDGTNSLLTLTVKLDNPIILDGKSDDSVSLSINDDLSGLLRFTALTRGSLRSDPTSSEYLEEHLR